MNTEMLMFFWISDLDSFRYIPRSGIAGSKADPFLIFREQGREGEREGEKHQCVVAPHVPHLGTWPATQACALTGNWTSDPLALRPVLNPLSHTSQGLVESLWFANNDSFTSSFLIWKHLQWFSFLFFCDLIFIIYFSITIYSPYILPPATIPFLI